MKTRNQKKSRELLCSLLVLSFGVLVPAVQAVELRAQASTSSIQGVLGDANQDGKFTAQDLELINQHTNSEVLSTSAVHLSDVAAPCDGIVDQKDSKRIESALAVLSMPSLPINYRVKSQCHDNQTIGKALKKTKRAKKVKLRTYDTYLMRMSKRIKGFGGYHVNSEGKMFVTLQNTARKYVRTTKRLMPKIFARTFFQEGYSEAKKSPIKLARLTGLKRVKQAKMKAVQGKYTFSALHRVRKNLRDKHYLFNIDGVIGLDTQERDNTVDVFFDPSKEQQVRDAVGRILARAGISRDMVKFIPRNLELFNHVTKEDLQKKTRPLTGGIQINSSTTGNCTMGFLGHRDGVPGFITNSHCGSISSPGLAYGQPNSKSGNMIADEAFNPPLIDGTWRWSDSLFAPLRTGLNTGLHYHRGKIGVNPEGYSSGKLVSKSGNTQPSCGTTVYKMGISTGTTHGTVECTCCDYSPDWSGIPGTPNKVQFRCQTMVESSGTIGKQGDSGSPVYYQTSYNTPWAVFLGLLWGGGSDYFVYSPLANILADLGNFDHTLGNDEPQVRIDSPTNGSVVSSGIFPTVHIEGVFYDPEGYDGTVRFFSYEDGYIGEVKAKSMESFSFDGPLNGGTGKRTIIAVAIDSTGKTANDFVDVKVANIPPKSKIILPVENQVLYVGVPYTLSGQVYDYESMGVECSGWNWFASDIDKFPTTTGCNPEWTPPGPAPYSMKIALNATDPQTGGSGAAVQVTVYVEDLPTQGPPMNEQLLNPANNSIWQPNEIVKIQARAVDPDGKTLTYEFTLKQGSKTTDLGTLDAASGATVTRYWKPSDDVGFVCGGANVSIQVKITDADNDGSVTVKNSFMVSYPIC